MPGKKSKKRVTLVHEHSRHVPVSPKNPGGTTTVHQFLRRLPGTYLDSDEIEVTFNGYDRKGLLFPTAGKLVKYEDADKYDEIIAVWTDFFNKKFNVNPPLDPDVVKALIGSESDFHIDPPGNKTAVGIAQITKETLTILQDPKGEAKDFIFDKIRLKDLKNPMIALPMAVRWLFHKRSIAKSKLKHEPTAEEVVLEYKGLIKSKSEYKEKALKKFREEYGLLKKK